MAATRPLARQLDYCLDFPYAGEPPPVRGKLRLAPADFLVDEQLAFSPDGSGEHVYLLVEKRLKNTAEIAKGLARLANVASVAIGFSGMKDRNAITRQWFSVHLPAGPEPDWAALNSEQIVIQKVIRHSSKLRRGQHRCNHFSIQLHDLEGDRAALAERLEQITRTGVPNYYGPQRFGRLGSNLQAADQVFSSGARMPGRERKSLLLSAARSYIFNQVLAERVRQGTWRTVLAGDVLDEHSSMPTGPLWGRGRSAAAAEALALESGVAARFPQWCHGLEHAGLQQQRRSLCLSPVNMLWSIDNNRDGSQSLGLSFSLGTGEFATSLLREVAHYVDMQCRRHDN